MSFKLLFCLIELFLLTSADETITSRYVYYPQLDVSYKFIPQGLVWGKAREYCLSENATLAVPKNKAERDTIKQIFEDFPENKITNSLDKRSLILGFHDLFIENEFLSESGYSMDYFYRDFNEGQPGQGRSENCIFMVRSGKYDDYPCHGAAPFVCQIDHSKYEKRLMSHVHINIDPGYILDPMTRKRYKLHTDLQTWGVARAICFAEGGNLAIIRNKQEEFFLTEMLNNPKYSVKYVDVPGYAFVGIHDLFIEGQFVTVKGENLQNIGYQRWSSKNGGTAENCGALYTTGELHDYPCDRPTPYFCEMQPNSESFSQINSNDNAKCNILLNF